MKRNEIIKNKILKFINTRYFLILCLILTFSSCSPKIHDPNIFLHIQKGKTFTNYLKQHEIAYDSVKNEYAIKTIKFNFQNKNMLCHVISVVNAIKVENNPNYNPNPNSNFPTLGMSINKNLTDDYFIITDDTKELIVLDGFYKYELFNGTRNENLVSLFDQVNKEYINYLIEKKIYTLDEIKQMNEKEKLNKLSL